MRRPRACCTTICRIAANNYLWRLNSAAAGPLKIAFRERFASLAAAEFLRYANHSKLTRFGVLDDLRRH